MAKTILDIAICINLHASILPKYRGASPIQGAIKDQEDYSGVTAMLMEEGLDSGDILAYSYISIKDMDATVFLKSYLYLLKDLTIDLIKQFPKTDTIRTKSSFSNLLKTR